MIIFLSVYTEFTSLLVLLNSTLTSITKKRSLKSVSLRRPVLPLLLVVRKIEILDRYTRETAPIS